MSRAGLQDSQIGSLNGPALLKAILSEKDTKSPFLKDFDSPFDIKYDLY